MRRPARRYGPAGGTFLGVPPHPPAPARPGTAGGPLRAPRPIGGDDEPVTYNAHVAPILWKRCAGCHRPGEAGPFSLLTYADAARRAEFLVEVTQSRQMPPWRPIHGY